MGKFTTMKKIAALFIFFTASQLLAHEFWLHPNKFIYRRGETINVRFFVGEEFNGENWKGDYSRVKSLKFYFSDVQDDLSDYIKEEKGDSLLISLFDEGTAMVTFHSTNSFVEMEAGHFNSYLKEQGLVDALHYRQEHKEFQSKGREYYQRSVKTVLQVGSVKTNVWNKLTELPLDIIPLKNPYDLKDGDSLSVKILFNKTPLTNALVKIWNRFDNQLGKIELTTNKNGQVTFPVFTSGRWMLTTVAMTRIEKRSRADWQSYWGSLTWGYVY